ncbi:MAG: hypothetical protein Kow0075_09250 [Salibacteraceae bacterium]
MLTLFSAQSCKKEGCTSEDAVNYDEKAKKDDGSCVFEYVADDNTFKDFMTWSNDATNHGADPSLGMAHAGNDSTVTRKIYFKDGQDPEGGVYPDGTMIVKHSSNPSGTVNEYTAMVKRGNNFDPDGNNWEYFMLNSDGTIKDRGANLMNGMCKDCHSKAQNDYVFSK